MYTDLDCLKKEKRKDVITHRSDLTSLDQLSTVRKTLIAGLWCLKLDCPFEEGLEPTYSTASFSHIPPDHCRNMEPLPVGHLNCSVIFPSMTAVGFSFKKKIKKKHSL